MLLYLHPIHPYVRFHRMGTPILSSLISAFVLGRSFFMVIHSCMWASVAFNFVPRHSSLSFVNTYTHTHQQHSTGDANRCKRTWIEESICSMTVSTSFCLYSTIVGSSNGRDWSGLIPKQSCGNHSLLLKWILYWNSTSPLRCTPSWCRSAGRWKNLHKTLIIQMWTPKLIFSNIP